MVHTVVIAWPGGKPSGRVEVRSGTVRGVEIVEGRGRTKGSEFAFSTEGPARLKIRLDAEPLTLGPASPLVSVCTEERPFSFFLRDVSRDYPIFIPACTAAVLPAGDARPYEAVAAAVGAAGRQTRRQRMASEPEEDFATAAAATRSMHVPTWLGLSRDMRIFEFDFMHGRQSACTVQPKSHYLDVPLAQAGGAPWRYIFEVGQGQGAVEDVTRRLEEGALPILHGRIVEEEISYECVAFATLETSALTEAKLRGTHFLVADSYGRGVNQTEEQRAQREAVLPAELDRAEEVVLWVRVEAINTGEVPRYAWFKAPYPEPNYEGYAPESRFEAKEGFRCYPDGQVLAITRVNGKPLPQDEMAVLLAPGESCVFDIGIPHQPVSPARARRLAKQDVAERLAECRAFWQAKLAAGAAVALPEARLEEMVRAGLLHLDLICFGLEPEGPVTPCVGFYVAIGSESAPIIQFLDSMGWHSLARRALQYFLEKQRPDGFMQNFRTYMLETGAVLWSLGEHYRYTRDVEWVREIQPKLRLACECLRTWRKRNLREDLRGRGYGMLDGKVADPADPYHLFMLNGYAYLGLQRTAEMLAEIDPKTAAGLRREAKQLKQDIRQALFDTLARSPVVPLGDGSWVPTAPPWAEATGPLCLYVEPKNCFHSTFSLRDALLGPLYLVLQEVVAPDEPAAEWLLQYHTDLFMQRNLGLAQPYYSPHVRAHALRGEVRAFLKAYYNGVASLADRETYTFWECYTHESPHKTHEEGWFLMHTRWMLYQEMGDTLQLLPLAPRAWFESGRRVELTNVATYFGPLSLRVESRLEQGVIEATVECAGERAPKVVELRLPHPSGRKATAVTGGSYEAEREVVRISGFSGKAEVRVRF